MLNELFTESFTAGFEATVICPFNNQAVVLPARRLSLSPTPSTTSGPAVTRPFMLAALPPATPSTTLAENPLIYVFQVLRVPHR